MTDDFYRAFEEKHRGSRELIKSRLQVYLPFVNPLCSFYDEANAMDLGCGRGEWLELLQEVGIDALGVDIDNGMLAACRERGFKIKKIDAISFLKKLNSESLVVVTGFHIAEHIPFADLKVLVQEGLRVLKPGGLLILETPNPENIVVGATSFLLDPTHQRPLPPDLLFFLTEHYGFKRSKILRLNESANLSADKKLSLLDVLNGVSPDYAVIAQKAADERIFKLLDDVFAGEYGLSLEVLAARYHAQLEVTAQQASQAINAIYASMSWRITAPFRLIGAFIRWFIRGSIAWITFAPMSRPRRIVRTALIKLKVYVSAHPRLKALTLRWLVYFPGLKTRLKMVGSQPKTEQVHKTSIVETAADISYLSPRARQIYADLKIAIERRQKENE